MNAGAATAVSQAQRARILAQSIGAVFAGFLAVVVLSLGTDQLMHVLNVYPQWGKPMYDDALCLLALSYRLVYTVVGNYITARLAPNFPMRHVWILGAIGTLLGILGAVVTIPMNLSPAWYPIAIAVTALPCSWLGGALFLRQNARQPGRS